MVFAELLIAGMTTLVVLLFFPSLATIVDDLYALAISLVPGMSNLDIFIWKAWPWIILGLILWGGIHMGTRAISRHSEGD